MKKLENQNKQSAADAMADCVIPQDILISILTRLSAKSILRFKSVCKPWLKLFATPTFINIHRRQFPDDPEDQNFMIYSLSRTYPMTTSLFTIDSDVKKSTYIDHPYPKIFNRLDFVGCFNGLICLAYPPHGLGIMLWNPATKMSKFIRLSMTNELGKAEMVSVGFGYDEREDDFKVVRIACLTSEKMRVAAEVYSTKFDSWKTIENGDLRFNVASTKNDAIVGGDPYWVAEVDENVSDKSHIVWFDVKKMVFKIMPSLNFGLGIGWNRIDVPLMDWKGSLATIMCFSDGCMNHMHIFVFDKDKKIWDVKHRFEPIDFNVCRCLQCSKSGKIIGVCFDEKLFVFDPENGGVKVIRVEEAHMMSFEIYEYTASLVYIDGMEPVKVKQETGGRQQSLGYYC